MKRVVEIHFKNGGIYISADFKVIRIEGESVIIELEREKDGVDTVIFPQVDIVNFKTYWQRVFEE